MARLKDYYVSTVAPAMMKKFGYKSVMQIPKLDKVIINVGAGEAKENAKVIDAIMTDIAAITGQKPVICRAKKSVANFKLREGMPIGVKVTLRSEKMYEFVDKLFNVAFPRVRDFRGINPNSFDGKGNYSTGIKEQLIRLRMDKTIFLVKIVICDIELSLQIFDYAVRLVKLLCFNQFSCQVTQFNKRFEPLMLCRSLIKTELAGGIVFLEIHLIIRHKKAVISQL